MIAGLRSQLRAFRRSQKHPPIPRSLRQRFTLLSGEGHDAVRNALIEHYFPRQIWGEQAMTGEQWLATAEGQTDLNDHRHRRLDVFRTQVIPWLNQAQPLSGANVLEVGCGTGASTVALAEQGARVVAVDTDQDSVLVAQQRCSAHGLDATFVIANAAEVMGRYPAGHFDFVIFFACLEHMTHQERMVAMRDSWSQLASGGMWCAVETPNRLWYFDDHTSQLNFYHWLPDELAFDYSRFSPRHPLKSAYRTRAADAMLSFLRHGRGMSYHEFDLVMGDAASLNVVSSLSQYLHRPGFLGWRALKRRRKLASRYQSLLGRLKPELHPGFFQPYLDLIICKS